MKKNKKILLSASLLFILFFAGTGFAATNNAKQKPIFEFPHFEFSLRPLLEFSQEQMNNLQAGIFKLQPGVFLNRYVKELPYVQKKLKQNPITFAKKELAGYNTVNIVREVFNENKERVAKLDSEDYIEINETLLTHPNISKELLEDLLKDRTMTQEEIEKRNKEIDEIVKKAEAEGRTVETGWEKHTIVIGGKTYTAGELSKMSPQETEKVKKQKELDDLEKQRKEKQKQKRK